MKSSGGRVPIYLAAYVLLAPFILNATAATTSTINIGDYDYLITPEGHGKIQNIGWWATGSQFSSKYPSGNQNMQFMAFYNSANGTICYIQTMDTAGGSIDWKVLKTSSASLQVALTFYGQVPGIINDATMTAASYDEFFLKVAHRYKAWARSQAWARRKSSVLDSSGVVITTPDASAGTVSNVVAPYAAKWNVNSVSWVTCWRTNAYDTMYPDYGISSSLSNDLSNLQNIYHSTPLLYVNGCLWDTNHPQYRVANMAKMSDGMTPYQYPGTDGLKYACQAEPIWQQTISNACSNLRVAQSVGIYYDMAANNAPQLCYDSSHAGLHAIADPLIWQTSVRKLMGDIGGFIISEGCAEIYIDRVDAFLAYEGTDDAQVIKGGVRSYEVVPLVTLKSASGDVPATLPVPLFREVYGDIARMVGWTVVSPSLLYSNAIPQDASAPLSTKSNDVVSAIDLDNSTNGLAGIDANVRQVLANSYWTNFFAGKLSAAINNAERFGSQCFGTPFFYGWSGSLGLQKLLLTTPPFTNLVARMARVSIGHDDTTSYENGVGALNWRRSTNIIAAATNVLDAETWGNAVQFASGPQYGNWGYARNVNDAQRFNFAWDMKTSSGFYVDVFVTASDGNWYTILYDNRSRSTFDTNGFSAGYVKYGLGTDATNNVWRTFQRDLAGDFSRGFPGKTLTAVRMIGMYGNCTVSGAILSKSPMVYENGSATALGIWNAPGSGYTAGATTNVVYDSVFGANVVACNQGSNWQTMATFTIGESQKYGLAMDAKLTANSYFSVWVVGNDNHDYYLVYGPQPRTYHEVAGAYVKYGLGQDVANNWRTFRRSLDRDLMNGLGVRVMQVNAIDICGDVRFGGIKLYKDAGWSTPVLH